jgi:small basic protein
LGFLTSGFSRNTDARFSVRINGRFVISVLAGLDSVVHGATRAQLAPAYAQRVIEITCDGDQGLIALSARQACAMA